MEAGLRQHAEEAIGRLRRVLDRGAEAEHADLRAATNAVIAFRDAAAEGRRAGTVPPGCLTHANALVSLSYGAEFPLSGLHFERVEQTCKGMRALLEEG